MAPGPLTPRLLTHLRWAVSPSFGPRAGALSPSLPAPEAGLFTREGLGDQVRPRLNAILPGVFNLFWETAKKLNLGPCFSFLQIKAGGANC